MSWTADSWRAKPDPHRVDYDDPRALELSLAKLRELPPLVTSWEIERLKGLLAEAQEGKRFLLQGGDCAETLDDCRSPIIANKLKILLQMSLVLVQGGHKPVIRVGRFAGQYAKPRSKPREIHGGVELSSYFGDLVNRPEFTAEARRADPTLLVAGYHHAAATLNFIRSLSAAGFADVHHPEYWDLAFFQRAAVPRELREEYEATTRQLAGALRFMEALGEFSVEELTRVDFFTSHEGLNLHYESAQTRTVPRRSGFYDLATHFPWIGERTRAIGGAHVEFFRGVRNPVAVKIGPDADPGEILGVALALNPEDEPGKIAFVTRLGASRVEGKLPPLVERVRASGRKVLWVCDPMHGNTVAAPSGLKTRSFDDILREVELTFDVHESLGTHLGGVHFELTGEDVTECLGGAAGITVEDLDKNYATKCDPRLNYRQALEMGFRIAKRMKARE